jgi:aldehyde dehydrogenase (NAD+)
VTNQVDARGIGLIDTHCTSIFVEGRFEPAHGSDLIPVIDPAKGVTFGSFPAGDETDVQRAVISARRALNDPSWAGTTGADRAACLNRLADLLEARTEDLARLLTAENGLTLASSRVSIGKSAAAYRYFAVLAEDLVVEERRSSQVAHAIVRREPVGVALLLVPWNGPQSLLSWKLAPALAAGCTVVIKPSPETTLDAYVLMELVTEAGVPPGVVNMVPGAVNTGRLLVANPGIDKVAFTGSTTAGRAIAVACAERLIPSTLELGGKSAAILLDDVDVDSFAGQVIGVCSPECRPGLPGVLTRAGAGVDV